MRLIDADALGARMYYEAFGKDSIDQRWDSGCWIRYRLFEKALKEAPTVEPEQKTGKWTKETKHHKDQFQEFDYYTIHCSVCGSAPEKNWHLTPFCPKCGSRMLEEEDE